MPEAVCRLFTGLSQGGLLCCQCVYSVYDKRLSSLGWIEQVKSILQTDMEGVFVLFLWHMWILQVKIILYTHSSSQYVCKECHISRPSLADLAKDTWAWPNLSSSFVRIALGTSEVFTAWNFFFFFKLRTGMKRIIKQILGRINIYQFKVFCRTA